MTNNASLLVRQQVPEFVVNDSPRFIEFLKGYYEFLSSYDAQLDRIRNVDETADSLVQFLRHEFATRFPNSLVDDRKLIKIVRELYNIKGTVNAIDLLFRIFFGEAVTVSEPGRQLLRTSDGKWEQLQSITVVSKFGALPLDQTNVVLQVGTLDLNTSFIEVSSIKLIATNTYIIYFRYSNHSFDADQEVDLYNGSTLVWKGRIVPGASSFEVVAPGTSWKVGQIIRFPGTVSNTVLQVTQTTPTGELVEVRPIEWGKFHFDNQSINVSPFPNRPTNATYNIQSNIVAYDSGSGSYVYDHVIEFNDYTDGTSEDILGYSDTFTESSYVGADYVSKSYVGLLVIASSNSANVTASNSTNNSVSIEEWLTSRATLTCKFAPLTTYIGKYLTEDGQISNPSIRLQDSYFYQLFSYVIQTTKSIDEYASILSVVHPAGYKYFNELLRTNLVIANDFSVERNVTNDKLFLNDLATIEDSDPIFDLLKAFGHAVTMVDGGLILLLNKPLVETVSLIDTKTRAFVKNIAIAQLTSDSVSLSPTINTADLTTLAETGVLSFGKIVDDSSIPIDITTVGINKSITEGTTSIDDNGSSNSQTRIQYTTDTYFSEDYVSDDITLQIG